MTEDITALITELRMPEYSPHAVQHRAADALEAQAKRITELEAETVDLRKWWARSVRAIQKREAERDSLAAQIAEAVAKHQPLKVWETDRSYTVVCRECKLTAWPCPTSQVAPASDVLASHDRRVRAEALRDAAELVVKAMTDPDRRRPLSPTAEVATDFANDTEWAALIIRAEADRIEHTPNDEHPTDRSTT
jgi:hypothetical protein